MNTEKVLKFSLSVKEVYDIMSEKEKSLMLDLIIKGRKEKGKLTVSEFCKKHYYGDASTRLLNVLKCSFEGDEIVGQITQTQFLMKRNTGMKTWNELQTHCGKS